MPATSPNRRDALPMLTITPNREQATAVAGFWREAGRTKWFRKDAAFDTLIRQRFLPLVEAASIGACNSWIDDPEDAFALMILLDQFPRNLFRGSAQALAADPLARRLAREALRRGHPARFTPELASFFFLPFEHSEALPDQDRSCALFRACGDAEFIKYADIHRDVIVRFGRFPHRNKALGRTTTVAEQAFLDAGGFSA
jgi:uncharacterized protein (DUF924 family)